MKKVQHYYCDFCGTMYSDMNKASACEKNHKKPESVVGARYLSKEQDYTGMPITITVDFGKGLQATYKR